MEEDYPRTLLELERRFSTEQKLATAVGPCSVRCVRLSGLDDRGHGVSGYSNALDGVVSRHVVADEPEERVDRGSGDETEYPSSSQLF